MRQFQYVTTTYVTENKETYFEIYNSSEMTSLAAIHNSNICPFHYMASYVSLHVHDVYITKFDFMNYLLTWYLHGCILGVSGPHGNTVKPVLRGHSIDKTKVFKTDGSLLQVESNLRKPRVLSPLCSLCKEGTKWS